MSVWMQMTVQFNFSEHIPDKTQPLYVKSNIPVEVVKLLHASERFARSIQKQIPSLSNNRQMMQMFSNLFM